MLLLLRVRSEFQSQDFYKYVLGALLRFVHDVLRPLILFSGLSFDSALQMVALPLVLSLPTLP